MLATGQNFAVSFKYGFIPFSKSRNAQLVLMRPKPHSFTMRVDDMREL